MGKKILFVATSDIHINTFHIPYLQWLSDQGHAIHLAVENRGDIPVPFVEKFHYMPFPRSPFSFQNVKTINLLQETLQKENFDLVHCHTPVPGAICRIAARKERKKGTRVLYTAHGFHFFKGAPFKNWLIYYPVEYFLSRFTDGIVTINKEDFGYINGKMFHKDSFYIKGIGVDSSRFMPLTQEEIQKVRTDLGYTENAFILLYVAEFIPRKNHQFIIEALPELVKTIPDLKVIFAGKGMLLEKMKTLAKKSGVEKHIDFLGFRSDVEKLAAIADVGISSSRHEGLGLGLAEEMLCKVPVVATIDKGHKEMIEHGFNGLFFAQNDTEGFIGAVKKLFENPALRKQMGEQAYEKAQEFTIENSLKSMAAIYKKYLES